MASAFIYYLIGDSKEFAKYVYEKIHKNFGQLQNCEIFQSDDQKSLQTDSNQI